MAPIHSCSVLWFYLHALQVCAGPVTAAYRKVVLCLWSTSTLLVVRRVFICYLFLPKTSYWKRKAKTLQLRPEWNRKFVTATEGTDFIPLITAPGLHRHARQAGVVHQQLAHHTAIPAPNLTLKQARGESTAEPLSRARGASGTRQSPASGPGAGSGTAISQKAGMEIETSAFVFKVAECLSHSDEEVVDGCSSSRSATGFLLNFCFALWICETSGFFFPWACTFFCQETQVFPQLKRHFVPESLTPALFLSNGYWFSDGQA